MSRPPHQHTSCALRRRHPLCHGWEGASSNTRTLPVCPPAEVALCSLPVNVLLTGVDDSMTKYYDSEPALSREHGLVYGQGFRKHTHLPPLSLPFLSHCFLSAALACRQRRLLLTVDDRLRNCHGRNLDNKLAKFKTSNCWGNGACLRHCPSEGQCLRAGALGYYQGVCYSSCPPNRGY